MGYFSGKDLDKKNKYEEGFDILMEYWDCLPENEKEKVDEKLNKLGI